MGVPVSSIEAALRQVIDGGTGKAASIGLRVASSQTISRPEGH